MHILGSLSDLSLRSGAHTSGLDSQVAQSIALLPPSWSVGLRPHEREWWPLGAGKLPLLTSSSSARRGSGEAGGESSLP